MRRLPLVVAFLSLLVAFLPPASADLASMVADLEVGSGPNRSSDPHSFVRVGSRVVFFVSDGPEGPVSVYATDGTLAGTRRLPVNEEPGETIGLVGGAYLWFSDGDWWSRSLWRTDGSAAGTERVVAGGIQGPRDGSPTPWVLAAGRLYFFRRAGGALELWESDGSAAGTRRTTPLPQVGVGDDVFAVSLHRGGVFFLTRTWRSCIGCEGEYRGWRLWRTDPVSGRTRALHSSLLGGESMEFYPTARRLLFLPGETLWATDGTAQGTAPLPGAPGEAGFSLTWVGGTAGGRLYFGGADPHHGSAFWTSDGTARGTRLLALGLSFSGPRTLGAPWSYLVSLGDRAFFAAEDGTHGRELWSTRGTPATTGLVVDLCPGPCSAFRPPAYPSLAAAGQRIFLMADDDSHGIDLWVTDGSAPGTRRVVDLRPRVEGSAPPLRVEGSEVLFYWPPAWPGGNTVELWASDGSPAGTQRLTDHPVDGFVSGSPAPSLARLGERVLATGWDPRAGFEPWVLERSGRDGRLLADLAVGGDAGSNPFDAVALGDRLLFMADRGASAVAWSTHGSAETTSELGELRPPRLPFEPPLIGVAGGRAYLNLGDLWRTDGAASGTVRLTDFAVAAPGSRVSTAIVDLGGRAVFGVTAAGSQETELWISDGTVAGTRRAGPPQSPLPAFPLRVFDLTAVGGEVFFWADDGEAGWEICATDAALATVRLLTDRSDPHEPGPLWVAPEFTRVGARVYFMVPDRWGGASLWRSDGSTAGTERVPPPVVGEFEQWRRTFAGLGGSVLLFTSSSNGFDLRLWSGDGSGTDWTQLRDFGAGSQLGEVVRRDDEVLFVVREGGGGGLGLYRTDGTAAGTRETLDFAALGVDEVRSVHAVGARLFFAAGPQVGRTELWVSDGTPATTRRLQEIAPGESGSEPRGFALAGSRLYFSADDGLHGRELWSLPLDRLEAPCQPSATALCLGDGRFRAELFRHDRAGERGDGRAVPWSSASGAFWFYDYGNPEAAVKVVDGGAVNGRYWLFFGPLGDAYVALTVTDLETGEVRRYPAEPGPLAAFADLAAFPSATAAPAGEPASAEFASIAEGAFAELERAAEGPPSSIAAPAVSAGAAGACAPGSTRLCLQDGRFAVGLLWRDGSGVEHQAFAFAHGDRAGYFAFYGARDLQAALKILDGRAINGRFWLFATSLTHLGYTLTVTDSETGAVYDYPKPAGGFASVVDLTSLR